MVQLLVLTNTAESSADILPALALLSHSVRVLPAEAASVLNVDADVALLDARTELIAMRSLCGALAAAGDPIPLIAVLSDGGLPALSPEWHLTDFVLSAAGPAEIEARIRLASRNHPSEPIALGGIEIDEQAYQASLDGKKLDLTYTEFELLKFLVQHPNRVFSREQLLNDVWGYDYFGGTRTVDVHVRRLRAKLGEADLLIGTVRNVGYRFAPRAG